MSSPAERHVEHETTVDAPADRVYEVIADVTRWPHLFPPTVHVERLEVDGDQERIQLWATANGEPKTWTSRRTLDPVRRIVGFRQERSAAPVAAMGGSWVLEPVDEATTRVRLLHDYRAVDDDADALAWIDSAVDTNSRSELAALRQNVELLLGSSPLFLDFEDSVRVNGPAKAVFDFVDEANRWPERLPHVASVRFTEDTPGLQTLDMDTRTADGTVHTTSSIRVTFPPDRIAYKQTVLPALMRLHAGLWTFREDGDGVTATSRHTVVLNEDNIAGVLGQDATVGAAGEFVRNALSRNSLATLELAKEFAERS